MSMWHVCFSRQPVNISCRRSPQSQQKHWKDEIASVVLIDEVFVWNKISQGWFHSRIMAVLRKFLTQIWRHPTSPDVSVMLTPFFQAAKGTLAFLGQDFFAFLDVMFAAGGR